MPAAVTRSISASAISGLVRAVRYSSGTPAGFNRARSLVQLSGRKRRNATITGTSSQASVSDTSVWQLAFLPSAEAYCEATPTECLPFFGTAVSSITITASPPPTSLSLERAVPSLTAPRPRRQQRQNGAIDHSRRVLAAPPSAEHSCDRQVQSTPSRTAGTSAAVPCALTGPRTASATVQALLPNPIMCSSWSALQKPTTHESQKK